MTASRRVRPVAPGVFSSKVSFRPETAAGQDKPRGEACSLMLGRSFFVPRSATLLGMIEPQLQQTLDDVARRLTKSGPPSSGCMHTFWDGQRFLMWDTRQIYELRCAYRLVGSTVGALPCNKRQICEYGVPLSLIAEEVILAAENGFMWVIDSSSVLPADPDIIDTPAGEEASRPPDTGWIGMDAIYPALLRSRDVVVKLTQEQVRLASCSRLLHAQVFRALWTRGFFITSGSCFGADYLCYPGDPLRHHAHLLVHVARPGRPMRTVEIACAARLANSVKKTAVLAECVDCAEVRFTMVESPSAPSYRARKTVEAADAACVAAGSRETDAESRAELALRAPLQGAPSVPQPRIRTRRPRAPWEEGRAHLC